MSKNEFLKQFEVKKPCSENWDEMTGGDEVRFCSHCNLPVNNLSAMTRKEAIKLVRRSKGRICVRYMQNPADRTPVFADRLYRITRRAGIAAGFVGASLSLSSLTYAQGEPFRPPLPGSRTEISRTEKKDGETAGNAAANLSGTIADLNGAVIPGVVVKLSAIGGSFLSAAVSNEQGFYEFKNIPAGNFSLRAEGGSGFKTFIKDIAVAENAASLENIQMEVDSVTVALTGVVSVVEFSGPLHRAVSDDDLERVTELIARGENVNSKDEEYSDITPLFLAVENGSAEIAELLLNFGAKVNARDDDRQTPLMRLDGDASPELVRLLLKHGAKINLTDRQGDTALILAAGYARAEVVRELARNGADVNAQNNDGTTVLMRAAYEDDLEKVKTLLLAGTDVNRQNKEGETAFDQTSGEDVCQVLKSHGAMKGEN